MRFPALAARFVASLAIGVSMFVGAFSATYYFRNGYFPLEITAHDEIHFCELELLHFGNVSPSLEPSVSSREQWPHTVRVVAREHFGTCFFKRDHEVTAEVDGQFIGQIGKIYTGGYYY